jgi:hypothetical protein
MDTRAFFAEMSRILKIDGLLFVSTDYWGKPVNTHGKSAFHVPIKIFTKKGLNELIKVAGSFGLELVGPADLMCQQKVITFEGLKYTFIYLTFKKSDLL